MKRFLLFLLLLVALAGGAWYWFGKERLLALVPGLGGAQQGQQQSAGSGGGRGPGGAGGRRPARPAVIPVLVQPVKSADVPVYLNGVGTVQAFNTATVRPQVGGRLLSVTFKEGQEVKQGDVLARIDPVTYQAALDQATAKKAITQAQLDNARRDFERYTGLARSDYATRQQADTAKSTVAQFEAQLRQDQAAIDTAQANLGYTTVLAPISGRTGIRLVDEGNIVSASDTTGLVVITQLRPISVLFTLPETVVSEVVAAVSQGPVALTASMGTQQLGEGTLEVVDNQIDQATGTVKLKGTFPNNESRLWPGQFVTVRLHLRTLRGVMTVPSAAVQQGPQGAFVYVVQADDTARLTPVTVTQQDENRAVIARGVATGDRVVTSGFASLQDGAKVSASEQQAEPGTAPPAAAPGEQQRRRPGNGEARQGAPGERPAGANPGRRGQGAQSGQAPSGNAPAAPAPQATGSTP